MTRVKGEERDCWAKAFAFVVALSSKWTERQMCSREKICCYLSFIRASDVALSLHRSLCVRFLSQVFWCRIGVIKRCVVAEEIASRSALY